MKPLSVLLLLLATVCSAATATPRKVTTRAEKVTLFTHGAQVTRTGLLDLPAGETTVTFSGLSPWLDEKSLQVAARGPFTVTAVERRPDRTDSLARTERLARIEAERKELARSRAEVESAREVTAAETELLKTNCSVANRTEATSLAAIRELTDYYASRLQALKTRARELAEQAQALAERSARLERELRELGGRSAQPASEVVVRVEAPTACRASFRLTYYVGGAGWYPTYDIRSEGLGAPVTLAYRANVFQNTGEEWPEVALTLSSSNPSTGSVAPQLRPYRLDYGVPAPRYDTRTDGSEVSGTVVDTEGGPVIGASVTVPGSTVGTSTDLEGRFAITLPEGADRLRFSFVGMKPQTRYVTPGPSLQVRLEDDAQQLDEVVVVGYGVAGSRPLMANAKAAPETAVAEDADMETSLAREVERRQSPMGYEFEIRRPYTIPSGGKSVAVEIARHQLPAAYLYRCSPRADRDAFLSASVTGWQTLNLLEGEASVYFENTFVGKSILSPAAQRDTLDFTLGRDRGIAVTRTRENYYKSLRTIGSTQSQEVAWRITVRNTRSEPVSLELCDQIPVSSNDAIAVTVEESSGGSIDRNGIVTWQLTLAPGEQRDLLLRYKVRYPKNHTLLVE